MCYHTTQRSVRHASDANQMLGEHERLVHWVVHRQWLGGLGYAEAVQAGRLALWQAVQGYDAGRGTAFSSYAVPAIRRGVWRAVAQAQAPVAEQGCWRVPQPSVDPEQAILDRGQAALVRAWVAQLPERLAFIIVAHYGLADEPAQSFAQIGCGLGVTRQRVQQLHREALLWLAQPSHSLALRHWLGRNTRADYQAFLAQQRRWLRQRRTAHLPRQRSGAGSEVQV